MTQYEKIIQNNLNDIFQQPSQSLIKNIDATYSDNQYIFKAFGQMCHITSDGIFLDNDIQTGALGIVLSLYAKHAVSETCIVEPLSAFKSFPNTAPYVGAFATHTEQILVPHVADIEKNLSKIYEKLDGKDAPSVLSGDFAFYVKPLPKIGLCYIFYHADEDFPASATCLFSNNASRFLPNDALADTGEYTSKCILSISKD
jgi:hypothetical protein